MSAPESSRRRVERLPKRTVILDSFRDQTWRLIEGESMVAAIMLLSDACGEPEATKG
jgi:hypothetical protein